MIKISDKAIKFNSKIYNSENYFYITADRFWDGGFANDASLNEKLEFYSLADTFSKTLKQIIAALNDKAIISESCCEKGRYFEKWKGKKKYDSYNTLKHFIKKEKSYLLQLPNDGIILDYIVENNFRCLSCIDIYLQNSRLVLQPTCHSEIIVYYEDDEKYDDIRNIVEEIVDMNQLTLKLANL